MPDENDLSGKLIYAARLCRSLRARRLLDHGLYAGQEVLLKSLARSDGQTMGSLAANLGVRPPTITKMVTRMEAQGLVKRETSGFDNRLAIVYILEPGEALLDQIDEAWSVAEAQAFGKLKDKDAKRLHKILDRIIAGADGLEADADL
jgi:DNA-binding MarR family transcriptional regulator